MTIDEVIAKYQFSYEDERVIIKTDFEKVSIYIGDNKEKYDTKGEQLIRFLNPELLEIYPVGSTDDVIHPTFFLPTHIFKDFLDSLLSQEIIVELKKYYPEYASDFQKVSIENNNEIIQNKDKSGFATSLYGTENATFDQQISAAKQILELNSMIDYKVAIGNIEGEVCLLEKGKRNKTSIPKSKHYNLWKFCEELSREGFDSIASGFKFIDCQ